MGTVLTVDNNSTISNSTNATIVNTTNNNNNNTLSAGKIAGIVVGAVVLAGVVLFGIAAYLEVEWFKMLRAFLQRQYKQEREVRTEHVTEMAKTSSAEA